jgi:hypothetical protein
MSGQTGYVNPAEDPSEDPALAGGAGTNLLTQGSCMNIYVSEFDAGLTGTLATFSSTKDTTPICDYYAVHNVSLQDMRSTFQFLSNDLEFANATSVNNNPNLEYKTTWPTQWNLNAANAMMDDANSSTATYLAADLPGTNTPLPVMPNTSPRSANLVVTHYLKYISYILFGTPFGIDLIDNAQTIATNFITTTEAQWQSNKSTYIINGVKTDADSNQLAKIIFRALLTDTKRFGDVTSMDNTTYQPFPFMENDSVNFVLSVVPPTGNNVNLSNSAIVDRPLKYCISLIINSAAAGQNTVPTFGAATNNATLYVAPIPAPA